MPAIDTATATRHASYLTRALDGRQNMRANPHTAAAVKANRPTQIITYYNNTARVFGIITATTATNRRRYLSHRSGNRLVDEVTAPDTYTAAAIKYTVLQFMGDDRCIAPQALTPDKGTHRGLATTAPPPRHPRPLPQRHRPARARRPPPDLMNRTRSTLGCPVLGVMEALIHRKDESHGSTEEAPEGTSGASDQDGGRAAACPCHEAGGVASGR